MEALGIARAIHVVAVLHWIGGVAFVTTVVLPAIRAMPEPEARLAAFEAFERRFSGQVKVSVPLAGLSGAYLADRLDLWDQFARPEGWWLAAMAFVWLIFMVILFVVEPLLLHDWFQRHRSRDVAFHLVQRAHWVLLVVATATAASAVLGSHGFLS
jgi:uncharacterized membrane protein